MLKQVEKILISFKNETISFQFDNKNEMAASYMFTITAIEIELFETGS